LIFEGPSGTGKRLVALATAQTLNCPNRSETATSADACGVCPVCARISRGVHPDVPLVQPGDSGSIKIDQVRDILERVAYRPFEGRRRVVIVDEADALVPPAQNALLKTLEEPPSSSTFVLVTSRPDTLLPTVRSRCVRLRFRPLAPDEVGRALVRLGRSEAEAAAIAAVANGSVGDAVEASGEQLMDARDAAIRVLAQAAAVSDPRRRLESAKELLPKAGGGSSASDRERLAVHLRAMASILRDVELGGAAAAAGLANPEVEAEIGRLSAFAGPRGVEAFAAVDQALTALDRNAGAKIVADWLVTQL
jgi:DNA polymerase-3 subunit delta'